MSLSSSINMATQALLVSESAISVVSNNVANVDNKNYSKLTVHFSDNVSGSASINSAIQQANSLSGVVISRIQRSSNEYLESYYRAENSDYNYFSMYTDVATTVENIMNELDGTGLSDSLSTFYEAVNNLAEDPTNTALRQTYISAAEAVCNSFNDSYEKLTSTQQSLVGNYQESGSCDSAEIGLEVEQVNNLLDQLEGINSSIIQTNSSTTSCSALLDKRDELLAELSNYINIDTTIESNSTVTVFLGNYELLSGSEVKGYLDAVTGPGVDEPVQINIIANPDASGASNIIHSDVGESITSGSIGAILDSCGAAASTDFTINGIIQDLDNLASAFADTLNAIQTGPITEGTTTTYAMCLTADYSATQESTEELFEASDGGAAITASNISVNSTIAENLNLIATGRAASETPPPPSTPNVGDNSNMTMINDTRSTTYVALNNQTFENYISSFASDIGTEINALTSSLQSQNSVVDSITSELASKTGVSLDEELSKLIQYKQMYEAAARLFKTCSDIMDTIINMVS